MTMNLIHIITVDIWLNKYNQTNNFLKAYLSFFPILKILKQWNTDSQTELQTWNQHKQVGDSSSLKLSHESWLKS